MPTAVHFRSNLNPHFRLVQLCVCIKALPAALCSFSEQREAGNTPQSKIRERQKCTR